MSDAWFARAVAAGATPRMPVADMFWGDRYGMVVDPFGHAWSIATHIRDVDGRRDQRRRQAGDADALPRSRAEELTRSKTTGGNSIGTPPYSAKKRMHLEHAMNARDLFQWRPLTADRRALWLKYSFGPGTANALALKLASGGWAVVSPPSAAPSSVFDDLERSGPVTALIAPNAYHNLGQAAWRSRYPEAISYAPEGAFERLRKKTFGVDFKPLEDAAAALAPIRFFTPDGMKTPDALLHVATSEGMLWWLGDQFSNITRDDQTLPLRLLSKLVGSGLGFRCNGKPELVYVRDRAAWLESMRAALTVMPPAIVTMAHGDPVIADAAALTMQALAMVVVRRAA